MSEGKGIWIDGKLSKEELDKLTSLIKEANERSRNGTLPMKFKGEKITFQAARKGSTLVISYGWNFPPKYLWVKEIKGLKECCKCFPNGLHGPIGREVWCQKVEYNFLKCPYGVKTPSRNRPFGLGA